MKKPSSRIRERVWTVFFMFSVTLVFGSCVSFLHVITQDRVRQNESLFLRRAVRAAAGLDPMPDSELFPWYDAAVQDRGDGRFDVRVERGEGRQGTVVFRRSNAGLWGQILTLAGVAPDADGSMALTGVAFLDQNETPGLGARITEPWFAEQLRGKRGTLRLVPEKTPDKAPDEIDAITGATVTSVAVRDLLNRVLAEDAARMNAAQGSESDDQVKIQ